MVGKGFTVFASILPIDVKIPIQISSIILFASTLILPRNISYATSVIFRISCNSGRSSIFSPVFVLKVINVFYRVKSINHQILNHILKKNIKYKFFGKQSIHNNNKDI